MLLNFSDAFGWPTPSCRFPNWLDKITWRDLDGKNVFRLDERGEVLLELSRKKFKEIIQVGAERYNKGEFKGLHLRPSLLTLTFAPSPPEVLFL